MLKRLFLAGTIAFPLYLMIALQQSPPVADSMARTSEIKERIDRTLDGKLKNFQQEVQKVRAFLSAE